MQELRSSYQQHSYCDVFAAIVDAFKPINCVELGVLDGYSTVAIAFALQRNGNGHLTAYDLFDDYQYKHGNIEEVRSNLFNLALNHLVEIHKADAYQAHLRHQADIDLLHVDISNTGETVERIMELWDPLMRVGGLIIFEGGSQERDQVDWMVGHNKPSIKAELERNQIILDKYIFGTYLKFPSLTVLLKKR